MNIAASPTSHKKAILEYSGHSFESFLHKRKNKERKFNGKCMPIALSLGRSCGDNIIALGGF